MLSDSIVHKLRERYKKVHPLIFQRSLDRAKDDSDLFDILDTIPSEYPIVWNNQERRWVTSDDIFQKEELEL